MNYELNCEDTETTRDLEDINAILEKAIIIFGFRDILTKYGIPAEETVTVSIVSAEDESLIISSAVIKPEPSATVPLEVGKNNFRADVIDFLKKTDALFKKFVCSFPGLPDETDFGTTTCEGNEIKRHYKLKIEYGDVKEGQSSAQAFLSSSMPSPSTQISFLSTMCITYPPLRRFVCDG